MTKQEPALAATFLAHAKVRFASPDTAALDRLLAQHVKACQARWPTVKLPDGVFVKHLAERLPDARPDSPIEPMLGQMFLEDLYLACGCLQNARTAIEQFERHYLTKLPEYLRSPHQSDALIEDICQQVRMKLLVATPDSPPKLGSYKGSGSLMAWVGVTASNMAIKQQGSDKFASAGDPDEIFDNIPAPELDAEMTLIKQRYQREFRQATLASFAALSDDERHLLRLYFVDRLSSYEIAPLFGVDQSTISRRLKGIREQVYDETRKHLQAQLGLSPEQFQSFMVLINSQLNVSISQLLGKEEEDGAPRLPQSR